MSLGLDNKKRRIAQQTSAKNSHMILGINGGWEPVWGKM